jgi:ankyrin repeat protein
VHRAAKDGDVGAIQKLLDAGAHVNTLLDSYDLTALHYAAWHGRTAAAFELIQRGAAIDARNRDQKTPLHLCAGNGKVMPVFAVLLDMLARHWPGLRKARYRHMHLNRCGWWRWPD